jgi:hypothetical protein
MEQKELFHFMILNPLAFYALFLRRDIKWFDVMSISMRSAGVVHVGVYLLPRDLFWLGYLLKSFESLE